MPTVWCADGITSTAKELGLELRLRSRGPRKTGRIQRITEFVAFSAIDELKQDAYSFRKLVRIANSAAHPALGEVLWKNQSRMLYPSYLGGL